MNSSFVTVFRYGAVAMIFILCVYRVLCGNDSSVRQGETAVGVKFVKKMSMIHHLKLIVSISHISRDVQCVT